MNWKILLPFENYTLTSRLSTEEVRKRISENVEPKSTFRSSFFSYGSTKPYMGEISGDTFEMVRIINYRNSFLPQITGQISSYFGQTLIKIKMQPHIIVMLFIGMWLWFFGRICLAFVMNGVFNFKTITNNKFSFQTLIPFIMLLFGWLLALLGFKIESTKSKKFLSMLLEGQETKDYPTKMFS